MSQGVPEEIAIIGVGYVGLPLAVCMAKEFRVTAFDINTHRIQELMTCVDRTGEVAFDELGASGVNFTDDKASLKDISFFIVTVPTPVDKFNVPDLKPLLSACQTLSEVMKKGATIVFESTVYPGLTEGVLAPKLEELTGLKFNKDFFLGYSPERVNPGDREHTVSTIKKIVSGSTPETADLVQAVYSRVISAGVYRAKNIATAEAAKVIENIQRDVNIGLINELTVLFDRLGLDIYEVLEASGTKWNFLPFKPGLVGGHCIGVDPFYLTHKALEVGYHPEMILAGRRINDSMADFFATKCLKQMLERKISPIGARVLVVGFTFKENCPDIRNTKVAGLVSALERYGMNVDVVDPVADGEEASNEYDIDLLREFPKRKYSAVIFAVPHRVLLGDLEKRKLSLLGEAGFIFDLKGMMKADKDVIH